jgi:hypothetical protein
MCRPVLLRRRVLQANAYHCATVSRRGQRLGRPNRLLRGHLRWSKSAGDVDTATDALSQAYSTVSIRPDPAVKKLRMEVATCTLPNLSLGSLEISTSTVRSSCYPLIAVCLPVGGQILITSACGRKPSETLHARRPTPAARSQD